MKRKGVAVIVMALAGLSASQAQTLNLFAAASLKESATEIAHDFEKKHPGVSVAINFGGSQQLAAQIKQGAPVDVMMSAGLDAIKNLDYEKSSLKIFALNKLALIVTNEKSAVQDISDLDRGFRTVFADPSVPVGEYTERMLAKAAEEFGKGWKTRVEGCVVSHEQDVRAVLTKVELGEADAGIVYVTDVPIANGKVKMIPIQPKYNIEAEYPAVLFPNSPNMALAKDFIEFLGQRDAQKVLTKRKFILPHPPGK